MNSWVTIFRAITLNINGLGDKNKWNDLWQNVPKSDVLCFQETHLHTSLKFAFCLHA